MKRLSLTVIAVLAMQGVLLAQHELPSGGSGRLMTKSGFTVSFSSRTNTPEWVAWELTSDEASATQYSRTDEFLPDPALPDSPLPTDYSRNGLSLDRGHMAPAADFKWSQEAMEESFRMSNICPQDHTLNEKTWCDLEKQCRTWAKHYGKLWICCGPVYAGTPHTIGKEHRITVPDAFFKVIMKEFKGKRYAIGFLFPNEPLDGDFFPYAISVDDIESLTGLDFFADLDDATQKAAESVCDISDWKYYLIPFQRNNI